MKLHNPLIDIIRAIFVNIEPKLVKRLCFLEFDDTLEVALDSFAGTT